MFNDSCLSQDEMELRDQKFLEGVTDADYNAAMGNAEDNAHLEPSEVDPPAMVTVRRDDATLHAAVVADWEAKYPLETIAEKNACDVARVTFELDVEAQMRAWHG